MWGTVSEALLESNISMSTWVLESNEEKRLCMMVRGAVV